MDMLRAVIMDLLDMGITEEQIIREVRSMSAVRELKKFRGKGKKDEIKSNRSNSI